MRKGQEMHTKFSSDKQKGPRHKQQDNFNTVLRKWDEGVEWMQLTQ